MKYKHGLAFPDADEYLFDRMPASGVWQQDALAEALKRCKQFRTAIDGGAHIGTWSLALARSFARVLAFEPSPDTYHALRFNTCAEDRIYTIPRALGAQSSRVKMRQTRKDIDRKHTGARYVQSDPKGVIAQTTIDALLLTDLDFLKLDLEGGECDAILGARATLLQCRPVICFESRKFEKRYGYPKGHAETLLREMGAVEFAVCGINRVWGWA